MARRAPERRPRTGARKNSNWRRPEMVKPEWGAKRTCPKCSTRFYDLGAGNPVHCLSCVNEFTPAPVVIEEFQSQGCSSCPPATANVNALAARPEVLALSFAVTYWDALGWKDTFASPAFTQRQWDYAHHAGRTNVATPQVIVNGGPAVTGGDLAELEQLAAKEGSPKGGPAIDAKNGAVALASGKTPQPATVWLVRYD